MRPLIVGEASRSRAAPFTGRTGELLRDVSGSKRLRDDFDLVNLLPSWPGRSTAAKGDAFPREPSRAAAMMLLAVAPHNVVILCGRRVASAFGLAAPGEWLTWRRHGRMHLGLLPHPSGVVRWWNEPENREAARRFMSSAQSLAAGRWSA